MNNENYLENWLAEQLTINSIDTNQTPDRPSLYYKKFSQNINNN